MNKSGLMKYMVGATVLAAASYATAQVTFYEREDYRGRVFATEGAVRNFERVGFNDRASSVVVEHGRWLVCTDRRFEGHCVVLRPGGYDSLRQMGLNDRVSSARPFDQRRWDGDTPEPSPVNSYEYRRRPNERLYEVPVTSVRAVVGAPDERCRVERQQVSSGRDDPNVGGAIAGAIIGGVLGHQVGGGSGKDIATAGGAVAGAVIGSRAGRDNEPTYRDVRRCDRVPSTTPAYWDVSYDFRGVEHRVQLAQAPGRTITVNSRGEPRG